MRDYSKVSGQFWTGKTGRALRGNMQAQIVALYLLTSPHSNMIGVYHCPVIYIAHETGSTMEGASKGLQDLIEGGFCTYERADLDPDSIADSFRDFWVSKPGKDGRKCDWQATWRNWVRSQKSVTGSSSVSRSSPVFAGGI